MRNTFTKGNLIQKSRDTTIKQPLSDHLAQAFTSTGTLSDKQRFHMVAQEKSSMARPEQLGSLNSGLETGFRSSGVMFASGGNSKSQSRGTTLMGGVTQTKFK